MSAAAQKLSRVGIGASQAPAVLGVSPFVKSLIEPWQDILGIAPAREETPAQRWGKRHEAAVRQEYADITGEVVVVPPESLFHPEHTWRRATPDGVIMRGSGKRAKPRKTVQIKTTDAHNAKEWGPHGSSEVPLHVTAQCVWEWHVLSARYGVEVTEGDVAVLIGGNDFRILHIARDQETEDLVVAGVNEFWERYVVTNEPPPLDATPAYRDYLARRHRELRGEVLQASEEVERIVAAMRTVRQGALELAETHTKLESELLLAIGDHAAVEGSFGKLSSSVQTRNSTTWSAVRAEFVERAGAPFGVLLDELIAKHTKESAPFRPLRFPRGFPRKPFGKDD